MKTRRPTSGLFLSDVLEWTQVIEITKVYDSKCESNLLRIKKNSAVL